MATPGVTLVDSAGNSFTFAGGFPVSVVPSTGTAAASATTNTAVATNASNVTVKSTAGRLFAVTVTAAGTVGLNITDGSGGTGIFSLTAAQAAAVGTYNAANGGIPFASSLVVVGASTNPAITVSYS